MPLSPESETMLKMNRKHMPQAMSEMDLEPLRKLIRDTALPTTTAIYESSDVQAPTRAGSVTLRVYRPSEATDLPVLMYMHGGAFALGDLNMHDEFLRILANSADIVIVSVDYRLAPEHPYPAGLDDCIDVWSWLQTGPAEVPADISRLAIGGDSAGGSLAFALTQRARDEGKLVPKVVLTAYGTAETRITNPEFGSREGNLLTNGDCEHFWNLYAPEGSPQRADPYCNPAKATDLSNLGANLVITSEYDPTRDATEDYAKRLKAAGNIVELTRYDGVLHGFFTMPAFIPEARQSLHQTVAFLKEHL